MGGEHIVRQDRAADPQHREKPSTDSTMASVSGAGAVQLHLRISHDLDKALRALALRRGQTLSGAVCYILTDHLRMLRSRAGSQPAPTATVQGTENPEVGG